MARIAVSVDIAAPPRQVWAALEDVSTHVDWMEDAVAIRFVTERQSGVGTVFDCDTKVGPFRLTDRMAITDWRPAKVMGVRHDGLVTGSGRFTLRRRRGGTRFTWSERLTYPWWMGGPVGAFAATPVLRRIWRRNLENLRKMVEGER